MRISVAIAPRRCIIHLQEQTARRKVAGMADRALKKKRRLEVCLRGGEETKISKYSRGTIGRTQEKESKYVAVKPVLLTYLEGDP